MKRKIFWLQIKKPIEFLAHLIRSLEADSFMSMEGDLSRCSFSEIEGIEEEPFEPFQKYTLVAAGRHDYVIIPLSEVNKKRLIVDIIGRIGLDRNVWHVEIGQNNRIIFGSYDNFAEDCVWIDGDFGEKILQTLPDSEIVSSVEPKEISD